jgi:hypothetical protein
MANPNLGGKPAKPKSWLQKEGKKIGKDVGNIGKGIGKAFKKGAAKRKAGGMKPVTMKGFGSG